MTSAPLAIEAREIVRTYGDRVALDGFTLDIPVGSVFGLLGPNGSGKSTFISLIAGMESPGAGELRVFGQPPAKALLGRVGTVFQENAQDPLMTVDETLSLAASLFGLGRATFRRRAETLLDDVGLTERRRDPVGTLSGGMRRRLELARALIHDPDLLILDEPTTGVDAGERRALWDVVLGGRSRLRTVLLATNDLHEADAVCDHVAFVKDGCVVTTGAPTDLKSGLRREIVHISLGSPNEPAMDAVADLAGGRVVFRDDLSMSVSVDDAAPLLPKIVSAASTLLRSLRVESSSLEDAYFQYVGTRLPSEGGR
jgi:ABC-2 type transport system ATP-binding protein